MIQIKIACSLEGRDLAVVKSLLNIKNTYHGITYSYTDDIRNCDLLILKEYLDDGAVYYGLNRKDGHKKPILPDLNPKSVQAFFNEKARNYKSGHEENLIDNINRFVSVVLDYIQSNSIDQLVFQSLDNTVIVSKSDQLVYSLNKDKHQLLEAIKNNDWQQIDLRENIDINGFEIQVALDEFCWNLGLKMEDELISDESTNRDLKYKLVSWPNYGELDFTNEFIFLSSLIWKKSETYDVIMESCSFDESTVKQFLNATLLTGHVIHLKNDEQVNRTSFSKPNRFLSGLKKVFGFK